VPGELISVWEDTYREIWIPLAEQEGVPDDVFSQLYRELFTALREPSGEEAQGIPLGDAIQLREAFDRAIALSGVEIERESAEKAFVAAHATNRNDLRERRVAIVECLADLTGDPDESATLLALTLSELAEDPNRRAEAKQRTLDGIVNDTLRSREAFELVRPWDLKGERALVAFLEAAFEILDDLGGDTLSNRYFNLLAGFIDKFSLRYDLRRPCTLCPTLAGVFASLVRDLRAITSQDAHLDGLMKDFEESVRDLRIDCSDRRIRTSIQKQVNLLEALGRAHPGVKRKTLGAISKQLKNWPHDEVMLSLQSLYHFTCDYPGIRHGGTPASALRAVDMRDMVAMSILLTGFTPYLSSGLNLDVVYRGA